jgi:tripartite-type tricarboxylate transporter receptor subunit TctC
MCFWWGFRPESTIVREWTVRRIQRTFGIVFAVGLGLSLVSACSSGSGGQWSPDTIKLIIATSPGGSQDTILGPFLAEFQKELGAKIQTQYRPGAGLAVGYNLVHRSAPDCTTLVGVVVPQILFSYLTQKNVDYSYNDFRALGGLAFDPTILVVKKDAPWKNLTDFISYAKKNPGQVKIGISQLTSNFYPSLVELAAATGVEFNIVPYNGGGPARKALLSGEVDASENGVYSGDSIRSETRALGVSWQSNQWANLIGAAPTFNDALHTQLPTNESFTTLGVPAGCATEHPDRFEKLQKAFAAARDGTDYRNVLQKSDALGQLQHSSGHDFDAQVEDSIDALKKVIDTYPALQPK